MKDPFAFHKLLSKTTRTSKIKNTEETLDLDHSMYANLPILPYLQSKAENDNIIKNEIFKICKAKNS